MKALFDYLRKRYKTLTQEQVDHVNYGLAAMEENRWKLTLPQWLYVFASVSCESNWLSVKEKRAGPQQQWLWKKYQSRYWNTGYMGRGPGQITWRANYLKAGEVLGRLGYKIKGEPVTGETFVQEPDLMLQWPIAFDYFAIACRDGLFRGGHTLARYFPEHGKMDPYNARNIVNGGHFNAEEIEKFWKDFMRIFQEGTK